MVLVDSCVWIEALRRDGDLKVKCAVEGLLDEYQATFCSPVRLEVLGGVRPSEREALESRFSILPYLRATEEDYSEAKSLAWVLAEKGFRVPWFDLLIAAIGFRVGVRIYSIDKHFATMNQHLGLPLYDPGYGGKFSPE